MYKNRRRGMFASLALTVVTLLSATASAQDYPSRPVKLIVAAAAGSSPDAMSRQLANALSARWHQPVVIENAVGLGGVIGTERAAKQAPDGYTLLVSTSGAMSVGGSLMRLPYDPVKDFQPLAMMMYMPNLLVVHPSVPAKTLAELIAYGKQNPGKLRYGHPGVGTTPHLSAELLKDMTGLDMQAIPYKSSAQMASDLLAGHYEVLFHNSSVMLPHVQSGSARPLAATGAQRVPALPEVPVVAETEKLKGFEVTAWWGIYAPAGTPAGLAAKLNADIDAVLKQPALVNWIKEQGGSVGGGSQQELRDYQAAETRKWRELITKANIHAE
ncbi:Tripartite tricarboxylate transporter family receptor [compost metagenome]|jgi:tripartite-type tricarboxylate transporter receptor subunit TctC